MTSKLRAERQARQWSLRQMSKLADIDFSLLSRYENGLVPTEAHRERLAKELRLTPEYLWPAVYGIQGVA